MGVTLFNDRIEITKTAENEKLIATLRKRLQWTNKSVAYQIKNIEAKGKVPKGVDFEALKKTLKGNYYDESESLFIIPAGFANLFTKCPGLVDLRGATGKTVRMGYVGSFPVLRPYQEESIEKALEVSRGVVCLATGMGKTLLAIDLIRRYSRNTLVIVPNKNIGQQFYNQLVTCFGEDKVGFVGDSKCDVKDITVGIIQSVLNKIDEIPELGMIVIDECHRIPAFTLYEIMKKKGNTGKIIGLSATPFRSDALDNHIVAVAGELIVNYGPQYGIENGYLARPTFLVRNVMTTGKNSKEKIWAMQAHVTKNNKMMEVAMKDIEGALKTGKNILILVPTIEFGKTISERIGCPFATGDDKKSFSYLEDLNSGKINCLCGTASKIGEGADTVRVDILILLSFPGSVGPLMQQLGRGLRLYPGKKKVVVIDYVPMGSTILKRHADMRMSEYRKLGEVKN